MLHATQLKTFTTQESLLVGERLSQELKGVQQLKGWSVEPSWCPRTQSDPGVLVLQASGPETGVMTSSTQSLNNQTQRLSQFIVPLLSQGSAWCSGETEYKQFQNAESENTKHLL